MSQQLGYQEPGVRGLLHFDGEGGSSGALGLLGAAPIGGSELAVPVRLPARGSAPLGRRAAPTPRAPEREEDGRSHLQARDQLDRCRDAIGTRHDARATGAE